ncbi:hypothetical protein Hamer_G005468 [Homarus americanus]|uniref:Uncharacterized protein n=1 Tax=Homarus americanus TaxID=6706 RepID=A0A8J5K5T1_HOMAM|nr:hypothetical protein Hamer_G005468 [Homarus americanus]
MGDSTTAEVPTKKHKKLLEGDFFYKKGSNDKKMIVADLPVEIPPPVVDFLVKTPIVNGNHIEEPVEALIEDFPVKGEPVAEPEVVEPVAAEIPVEEPWGDDIVANLRSGGELHY